MITVYQHQVVASPSRVYRVRKKVHAKPASYKTLKIAKRVPSQDGFPKPLSCEEDFVLEMKGSPLHFLRPVSSFYELPELSENKLKLEISPELINPRSIVGPFEDFRKTWMSKNEFKVKELLKRNKSLMTFTTQAIKRGTTLFLQTPIVNNNIGGEKKEINRTELLHNTKKKYLVNANKGIKKKLTLRKKLLTNSGSLCVRPIS